jgi:hypothetical protein
MKDRWHSRDLPVLEAIVAYFDAHDRPLLNLSTVAEITGRPIGEVGKAAQNLDSGGYLDLQILMTGPDCGPWFINRVHASALLATGAWPTAESISKAIAEELEAMAETLNDPKEGGWLKKTMTGAGEISKDVFTRIISEVAIRVILPGAQ